MLDRKNIIYKGSQISTFLKKDQFLIFKEKYNEVYSNADVQHPCPAELKDSTLITELNNSYTKKFLKLRYRQITGFPYTKSVDEI